MFPCSEDLQDKLSFSSLFNIWSGACRRQLSLLLYHLFPLMCTFAIEKTATDCMFGVLQLENLSFYSSLPVPKMLVTDIHVSNENLPPVRAGP